MTATKLLTRVAPLAIIVAVLVGPGAGASQRAESILGVCNFEGKRYLDSYSFMTAKMKTVSRGVCIASVNGGSVESHGVKLVTTSTLPLIDIKARGKGWMRVDDYSGRIRFGFQRVAGRALLISGAAGTTANAALHRPSDTTLRHQSEGRQMLVLQSATGLRGL